MRTVDEYIESLPDNKREICELLREIIFENVPGIEEKVSFKIPFYHYFGMFMYLNNTKEGVDVAFCRGKDLLDEFPHLSLKNRATIATVTITTKKDIASFQVREMIVTAAAWNEEAKRLKIPMVKKTTIKKKSNI
ncbi:MAG: DUF1801 domain-containing protein [Bacteroidota bacterium]|nr:DUF1801 domain-containing protein [Bacteroidota bacterium]